MPVVHQLVVQLLQLLPLLFPGGGHGLVHGLSDLPVRGLLLQRQAAAADLAAVVVHPARGDQLMIPADQRVFLLLQRDEPLAGLLQPVLHQREGEGAHQLLEAVAHGR